MTARWWWLCGAAPVAALLALAGSVGAQPSAPPPVVDRSDFVQVSGRRFVLRGSPFRFVGANASIMHGARHRAAVEPTLDAIAADGLKVVRVWALGEQPENAEAWTRDYAFRIGRNGWVTESFEHLDRVLDAAHARGLRVVVVLANRWSDYGGVPRYLSWLGGGDAGATTPAERGLARFFGDPEADALYREHVARVVTRVNARNGVAYRDDPTILAWELINESDVAWRDRDALVDWTSRMARYVHDLDGAHLVSAGHIGYTFQRQRSVWLDVQRLPAVDYADAHAYPAAIPIVRVPADLDDFVDDAVQLAHHVAHKPFVWGELGFTTRAPTLRGVPRAQWFERFLARSERDDVDGLMVWIYSSSTDRPREHGLLVDGPDARRTRDVRAVLSRYAARWNATPGAEANPRLGASQGEAPLWATRRHLAGPGTIAPSITTSNATRWSWAPEHYTTLDAENAGRWDGFAVMHVYGSAVTSFTYRARTTPTSRLASRAATRLRVRLRASSELPGHGEGCGPDDGSTALLRLDDVPLGELVIPPDDGVGQWIELTTDDPRAITALRAPGVHTLRVEVPDGPRANGLCLYGQATGQEPLPPNAGALPGRVELTLLP